MITDTHEISHDSYRISPQAFAERYFSGVLQAELQENNRERAYRVRSVP
jgi:hypothetical protein